MALEFAELATSLNLELDEDNAMLVGQHWGMPTRVIDFSRSPYVAAYFAARSWLDGFIQNPGASRRPRPVIWILETADDEFTKQKGDPTVPLVEVIESHLPDERMIAQDGLFVVHHAELDLVSALARMGFSDRLTAYTLAGNEIFRALSELDRMAINDRTMFPGLDGVVKHLTARAILSAHE